MPSKPSSQELARLNALLRSPAVLARIQQIKSDPKYANSVPLQWNAINSYLFGPGSPMGDVNAPNSSAGSRGNGTYRYDIQTNSIKWEPLGPQHWYTDPGVLGPIAVGAAAGAFGGPWAGGGGGSGGAAFDAVPNIATPAGAANAAGVGGAGTAAAMSGLPIGNTPPPGGVQPPTPPKSLADQLKDMLTNPNDVAGLGALISALVSGSQSQEQKDATKQMQRINAITEARMRRADPLHQVAVNLAFGRMPTNYRQGVNLQNVPLPE